MVPVEGSNAVFVTRTVPEERLVKIVIVVIGNDTEVGTGQRQATPLKGCVAVVAVAIRSGVSDESDTSPSRR